MPDEPSQPETAPRREAAVVAVLIVGATMGIVALGQIPGAEDFVHAGIALSYLMVAIRFAQRDSGGLERFGIALGGLLTPRPDDGKPGPLGLWDFGRALGHATLPALRETGSALLLAAITFPPFVLGFYWWNGPTQAFQFTLPPDLVALVLTQVLVIAIPEEVLFRGYFQTRLADVWPKTRRILGAELPLKSWLTQALLFALVHYIVDWDPQRLAVFFPALLFGWLRARRGSVGAAVAYHVLCNLIADILYRSWLY